jgi:hypothetical protein
MGLELRRASHRFPVSRQCRSKADRVDRVEDSFPQSSLLTSMLKAKGGPQKRGKGSQGGVCVGGRGGGVATAVMLPHLEMMIGSRRPWGEGERLHEGQGQTRRIPLLPT